MNKIVKLQVVKMDYDETEREFLKFITWKDLDQRIKDNPTLADTLKQTIYLAINASYRQDKPSPKSHLFLQRILYYMNRLKLFWYDDLENYINEDSPFLLSIRSEIEAAWQVWELSQLDITSLKNEAFQETIRERTTQYLCPKTSSNEIYIRDSISLKGYRRLLEITSLNGMVEASQLSRVIGGVGNKIQSMLTRILLEEYGGGKLHRKHTSFFSTMLDDLGMNSKPEAYLKIVPWSTLANINHSFFLCEKKRHFLRYVGGLLLTEISTPTAFSYFKLAGQRLGLEESTVEYWDLHMKEDERHGQWMLEDVALPLAEIYPENAWEILLGYEQQKFLNARAESDLVQSLREVENLVSTLGK